VATAVVNPALHIRLSPSTDVILHGPGHAMLVQGARVFRLDDREVKRLLEEGQSYRERLEAMRAALTSPEAGETAT
jgi:hypothetical protein